MLLYIEDNTSIAENVIQYLKSDGYEVKYCADGESWLEEALSGRYECIILDIMLPKIDGFTVCRKIREKKSVPIIMTTAKGELTDKGEWFDGWADDYLVKPFELAELVMRVRNLIQRTQISDTISIADVDFMLDENRCLKAGQEIKLTLKERQIMFELLEHPWRTCTRADIVEAVRWTDALYASEGKLDVYIATIRKKLGKDLIHTVKGLGYKLRTD